MQLWLADPLNVEKLKQAKLEEGQTIDLSRKLELNPSSRASLTPSPLPLGQGVMVDKAMSQGGSDKEEVVVDDDQDEGEPPSKRQKVTFTEEQKEALKAAFAVQPYPNPMFVEYLSKELNVDVKALNNWFHNYRTRHQPTPLTNELAEMQVRLKQLIDKEKEDKSEASDDAHEGASATASEQSTGRPRRKPAAPQWVNPELRSETTKEADEEAKEEEAEQQ